MGKKDENFGDGEVANGVSWVLSGDMNGTEGNSTLSVSIGTLVGV